MNIDTDKALAWLDALRDGVENQNDSAERVVTKAMAAESLFEALELATKELNIVRARDGAPQHIDWHRGQPLQTDGCTHAWWNELTEKCFAALEKAGGH